MSFVQKQFSGNEPENISDTTKEMYFLTDKSVKSGPRVPRKGFNFKFGSDERIFRYSRFSFAKSFSGL